MQKRIAAAASSLLHRTSPDAPHNAEDAVAVTERILSAHAISQDNTLSEAELDLVSACLDTIGSEEASVADDGSLQGRENITYTVSDGSDISVTASADIEVKNVWDRTRREWACSMAVQRATGSVPATKLLFTYHFASFGASEDGNPIVLFNFTYERAMNSPSQLANFNKGVPIKATEYDITSNVQWGYLVVARCRIQFADGTVLDV